MELEEAANAAQAQADHEAETLAALENAARDSPFPLSKDQWTAHVYSGLCPAFNYFMERVAEGPGGDRFAAVELFRAFRIFNPSYAKTLSHKDAFALIEKLDHYPIFRKGGYVAKLKKGWNAYKQNASFVVADFGKTKDGEKDKSAILTWHYRMFLRIDEDEADDIPKRRVDASVTMI